MLRPDQLYELWSVPAFSKSEPEFVRGNEIGSDKQTVTPGIVLVCKINPRINRIWIVGPRREAEQIASTEWIPFFPVEGVDPPYLRYYLQRDHFRNYLASNVSGVGGSLMRVRSQVVDSYPFVLAPVEEQRRIVAAIEEHLSRLDAAIAGLSRAQSLIMRYRAAVLKSACDGRFSNSNEDTSPSSDQLRPRLTRADWPMSTIGALTPTNRPSAYGVLQPGPNVESGVPLIRVGDINGGRIDSSGLKRISREIASKYSRTKLRGGEVVMTLVGSIGRTAVVPRSLAGANVARAVAVIPVIDSVLPEWVNIWFRTEERQREMNQKSHEVARKTLNLEDVRSATIALPPIAEQRYINGEVEARLSKADAVEQQIGAALTRAGHLRESVLRQAFEGRLVQQDPCDQPASVILQRIAQTKAGTAPRRSRLGGRG